MYPMKENKDSKRKRKKNRPGQQSRKRLNQSFINWK